MLHANFKIIGLSVLKKKILNVFTIFWHGGPNPLYKLFFSSLGGSTWNLPMIGQAVYREKDD